MEESQQTFTSSFIGAPNRVPPVSPTSTTTVVVQNSGSGLTSWLLGNKKTIGFIGMIVILVFFAGYLYFKLKRDHAQELLKAKQKAYKKASEVAEKKLAKLIVRRAQTSPSGDRKRIPSQLPTTSGPVSSLEGDQELVRRHQAYLAQLHQQQKTNYAAQHQVQFKHAPPLLAQQPLNMSYPHQPVAVPPNSQQPFLFANRTLPSESTASNNNKNQIDPQMTTAPSASLSPSSPDGPRGEDQAALLQAMADLAAKDMNYASAIMAQISNASPPLTELGITEERINEEEEEVDDEENRSLPPSPRIRFSSDDEKSILEDDSL